MKNINILPLLAGLCLVSACATNPVTGKKQFVLTSESQELAMGKEADPQVIAEFGLYPDSSLQQYLREKGHQIAAISHRPNIEWNFRLLDNDVVNAFAIPGGYVYITRGIMAHFNDEAQFMGVLGHEIGHVAARHSVEQQRNQILGQVGLIAGVVLSPTIARFGESVSQGLGLLLLKNSRDAEREADKLGVEYSSKTGYNAHEMANFFKTLERQGGERAKQIPSFLSTHPDPGERYQTVNQMATDWQKQLNLTNPVENRNSYLRRIEGIIYGEDPRGGYLENSTFYHPELRFQFTTPQGWSYQNSPQQVQLASTDGKAILLLRVGQGASPQEAANTFVQQNSLQVVNSGTTTINGLSALVVAADQPQSQQSAGVRTLNYFIQYGNSIYHLLGASSLQDFNSFQYTLEQSMQSFRQLTDMSKINKKPERVRVRTVNTATSLSAALRSFGVPEKRLEELAILNGMQLTDNVPSGMMIKILGE